MNQSVAGEESMKKESFMTDQEWREHLARNPSLEIAIDNLAGMIRKAGDLQMENRLLREELAKRVNETPEQAYSRGFQKGAYAEDGDTCVYDAPGATNVEK